jgi:hypothetical protein
MPGLNRAWSSLVATRERHARPIQPPLSGHDDGAQLGGSSLDEVMPHRLWSAPQRDGSGEPEIAARQQGGIFVCRVLPPANVDEYLQVRLLRPSRLLSAARGLLQRCSCWKLPRPERVCRRASMGAHAGNFGRSG